MTRYDFDSTPRIAPAAELAPDIEAAITAVMRGRPPLLLFTTLARDARLFHRFFGGGLLDRGHLTLRQREIVIDRTTALCRAEYEWGVHVATYGEAERKRVRREYLDSTLSADRSDPHALAPRGDAEGAETQCAGLRCDVLHESAVIEINRSGVNQACGYSRL